MTYIDISNFIQWFISIFIEIGTSILDYLDEIQIYSNVSLLDFIITITIIGAFIGIILTLPNTANRITTKMERKQKNDKRE